MRSCPLLERVYQAMTSSRLSHYEIIKVLMLRRRGLTIF